MKPEDFPDYNGPVGVFVSGGLDSALILYYALKKYTANRIHIFTVAVGSKEQLGPKHAIDVVNKCVDLTGNRNVEQHISYVYEKTLQPFNLPDLAKEYLYRGDIDVLFFGVNENPPEEVTVEWPGGPNLVTDLRDPNEEKSEFPWEGWITPWININKKEIAKMYEDEGLMHSLFPLTRSCIKRPEDTGKLHCGECWWCKEREWGFGSL